MSIQNSILQVSNTNLFNFGLINFIKFAVRTVKIQGSWKFCIEQCQASCSELKAKLSERVQLDTNAAVHHIGMFLFFV